MQRTTARQNRATQTQPRPKGGRVLDDLIIAGERQRALGDSVSTPQPRYLQVSTVISDLPPVSDRHEITSRVSCWHVWPPELEPDGACERCYLAYREWSM